jgi:hypothetical protein
MGPKARGDVSVSEIRISDLRNIWILWGASNGGGLGGQNSGIASVTGPDLFPSRARPVVFKKGRNNASIVQAKTG